MAKVSVPISNLQEGDTIAVDDLDLYIARINKLDGQSAATSTDHGINGDNVQTEGIDKRNLHTSAIKGTFAGFGTEVKTGQAIQSGTTFSDISSMFETCGAAKGSDMFLCVFNFDFGVFAVDEQFQGIAKKGGGFLASFRIVATADSTGNTETFGETRRDFSSGLVAAAVTYDITVGSTVVRTTNIAGTGLPHKMHVPLQNTATLFLGGTFQDVIPSFFPTSDTQEKVTFKVQGMCGRTINTSAIVTGKVFNFNTFARTIKK